jgi:hypothetical protein
MTQSRRFAVSLLVFASAAVGQSATTSMTDADDAEFRDAIRLRLPQSTLTNAARFVLNRSVVAVPLLQEAVESDLTEGLGNSRFVSTVSELIAFAANTEAIDAIARLCLIDEKQFSPMVDRVLNHAITRKREFEVADYAAERYPTLRKYVGKWLETDLSLPLSEELLARSVLRHEAAGDRNPARSLLPLITERQREHFETTLENVRTVERERERHRQ